MLKERLQNNTLNYQRYGKLTIVHEKLFNPKII